MTLLPCAPTMCRVCARDEDTVASGEPGSGGWLAEEAGMYRRDQLLYVCWVITQSCMSFIHGEGKPSEAVA